ncbi:MAG: DUF2339 domain-containing protein, partial [Pseudomonadota bacterium]|nr:DUF2339 domain-containing protein [Pseudomonadota bacterium]
MIWIGLVVGIVAGAAFWGLEGAVVLGFIGWLVGVILKSRRRGTTPAMAAATARPVTQEARIERLEKALAQLEARMARIEPPPAVSPAILEPAQEPMVEPAPVVAPPPLEPPPPPLPKTPNPFIAWLAGGNTIARVGLLILFIGLAFLLKYAADHQMLPVELRVASVALGGIALLVIGWRLRESRRGYALGMQGAGVAVLYLTTFAALRLWGLLPPEAAFVLLAAIAVFSAILAIRQDAMVLA